MSPRRSPHLPWLLALLLALAPASARAAAEEGRITWSGAALAAVQAPDARREDGRPALEDTRFVLMRAALGAHAHLGDAWTLEARVASDRADALDGSPRTPVTLERCELAWARSPRMTWRIGRLPVPVGDPDEPLAPGGAPGIARPDVEQLVIPAPWSAYGLAATGVLGHRASWTLATLQALDARGFRARTWVRDGRPGAADLEGAGLALAARLDLRVGRAGSLGGSTFTSDRRPRALAPTAEAPRVWVSESHARLARGPVTLRAMYAMSVLWDHAALTRTLGFAGGAAALGKHAFGGLLEGTLETRPGRSVVMRPFARVELTDTQDGVGAIGTEDTALHRTMLVGGLECALDSGWLVVVDREQRHHEDRGGVGRWNLALGYRLGGVAGGPSSTGSAIAAR